ncbi:MAG: methyltransferase domain-containing protein [Nannocystis sp.]|nr:methyltransferase domain-containing protein [Nannocystis sp.]
MATKPYTVRFIENDQEVVITGALRPQAPADMDGIRRVLDGACAAVEGILFVNLRKLRYLNHLGFVELIRFVERAERSAPELRIKLVISSVIPWAPRRFAMIADRHPNLIVEHYDRAFYPGQGVIENDALIPVLRTQTSIIWHHERHLLREHGLRPGMTVADVCCGIGDFAVLLRKEYKPARIVAVDHSRPFLAYATQVARDFGISDIEYQYGDATSLLLADELFDFVTSRLSLQVFNEPEKILRELIRICRPGGRIYLTNEMMSHNYGYPRHETVAWTYNRINDMCASLGMDLSFGPKMYSLMTDLGFEDIKIETIEITNRNTVVDDFARVIESWEDYVTGELSTATGQTPEMIERLRTGLRDHIYTIRSRRGYATWPLYIASGRRPVRARAAT